MQIGVCTEKVCERTFCVSNIRMWFANRQFKISMASLIHATMSCLSIKRIIKHESSEKPFASKRRNLNLKGKKK